MVFLLQQPKQTKTIAIEALMLSEGSRPELRFPLERLTQERATCLKVMEVLLVSKYIVYSYGVGYAVMGDGKNIQATEKREHLELQIGQMGGGGRG